MNVKFLRTIELISACKLTHITYRWKAAHGFTLEQIASVLYKSERKRAKEIAKFLSTLIGLLCGAICLYGTYMMHPYTYVSAFLSEGQPAVWGAEILIRILASFLTFMFIVGLSGLAAIRARTFTRRIVRSHLMDTSVPAGYALELKKFSDALHAAIFHLGLRDVRELRSYQHRDDIAALAAGILDIKAKEIISLERLMAVDRIDDDMYSQLQQETYELREQFRLAYNALEALHFVGGGYTNFFRRAQQSTQVATA